MKVCLYVRISTGEQSNFSLEAQESELRKYSLEQGFEIVKVYADKLSGLEFEKREGLQNLLDDAEKGLYDILLITETDRLARDQNILGYIKLTLQLKGIKIIAVNEPEAQSEYDELIKGIISLFSSFEAKRRKRRCQRGIKKAREERKPLNKIPKGYKLINKGTKASAVIINEAEAQLIKSIFEMRAQGKSVYAIARITTQNKATISYMLKNPFYYDEDYLCKHTAIVSKDIYDKINKK